MAKSALERFLGEINTWIDDDKDVDEAKVRAREFIESTKINDNSKRDMIAKVDEQETILALVSYIYNSFLTRIGLGV